jgi:Plasmid pRiA4b ORF-3-like protein
MARAKRSITPVVYQIKVTLKGSKPPIWRRMQVTSETTLAQFHRILQQVMGWEGYHLYRFEVGRMEYGDPSMLEEMEGEDARRVTLAALVRGEKDKFLYTYCMSHIISLMASSCRYNRGEIEQRVVH